jgi:hypothetical protein
MGGARPGDSDSEEDEDDEDEDAGKAGWGRKSSYRGGDTADLEIGQDVQDAEDEEEAGLELLRGRLKGMKEQDFFPDLGSDDDDDDEDEDEDEDGPVKFSSSRGGSSSASGGALGALEAVVLGASKVRFFSPLSYHCVSLL